MQSYQHLFKSYPAGSEEAKLWRRCYRQIKQGQYTAEMCVEIEKRTEGKVMAKTLRPDLFVELDYEAVFKDAIHTWAKATTHPTKHDRDLVNRNLIKAALTRYKTRDPEFYTELKAVSNVL